MEKFGGSFNMIKMEIMRGVGINEIWERVRLDFDIFCFLIENFS